MCMLTALPTWCAAYDTPARFTKCSQAVTKHKFTYTLVLIPVFTTAILWLHGPPSGGEPAGGNETGGPVGSGDTSIVSTSAWPPQCSRVLIYGLERPIG